MQKILPFIITLVSYFLLKLSGLGIRISDANIYWYNGYLLNQGKILYKDIPFANFPMFAYISSFYHAILGGSLKLFFLSPTLEVIAVASLIFYITYQKKKYFDAYISSLLYLTNTPALEGIFDAHPYYFREKKYDRKFITDKALSSKTIVVTNGIYYPGEIDKKIIDDEIMDKERIEKSCNMIGSFPVFMEGIVNRLNIFKCD